ncbi:AfsR/SARP family transcriptional regulator [Streptomyces sp. NPDC046939]|uniref:AfsR/SARP family transcriptional regulator n=1 Tax=Streptomyces sp. NPDC046939 TaxID=3155376 RepID=UPI0033FF066B
MEFRILGSVQICDDQTGMRVMPSGAKQRALLGALVVCVGQEVPSGRLVEELWGDRPPLGAANALQAHVARLRRLLLSSSGRGAHHDWLVTQPTGYALRADTSATDAQRFHRLVSEGREAATVDPDRSVRLLRSALGLWRGRAFEGSERGPICATEASILEEARMVALELLYDASLRAGQHERITGELEGLTVSHPLREQFHELLMIAQYRCGRRAEALGTYERLHRRLIRDLGVEPGPSLRRCRDAILYHFDPHPGREAVVGPSHGSAAPHPPALGHRPDDEVRMRLLAHEIALLRGRVEELYQEHRALAVRLSGSRALSLPPP